MVDVPVLECSIYALKILMRALDGDGRWSSESETTVGHLR
jgi:hypothetical protein